MGDTSMADVDDEDRYYSSEEGFDKQQEVEDEEETFTLHVAIRRPTTTAGRDDGRTSDVWPSICVLHVAIDGGERVEWVRLPYDHDQIRRWGTFSFDHRVRPSEWGRMSVDLEVERLDGYRMYGVYRVFRADEPQTSEHMAVIGRARVRLVDALMRFDDDVDDGGGGDTGGAGAGAGKGVIRRKKKGDFGQRRLADGTQRFQDWVRLTTLKYPAIEAVGKADGEPTNVVCGGLEVSLSLSTVS